MPTQAESPKRSDGRLTHYMPSVRAERLVAAGRLVLAIASLGAVWLDPDAPSRNESLGYGVLLAYAIHSGALLLLAWQQPTRMLRLRLSTHVIDLIVFTVVIYLTEGATSPFFLYFVFAILSATMRFSTKGTIVTAVAALLIFIGMGTWASVAFDDPDFEPNRFFIRSVYLAIVAVLLIYLSAHQESHRGEMARLARWPDPFAGDSFLRTLLTSTRDTQRAQSVALQWRTEDDPGQHLVWLFDDEVTFLDQTHCLELGRELDDDFYCDDLDRGYFLRATDRETDAHLDAALASKLRSSFRAESVLVNHIRGKSVEGHLAAFDISDMTSDDLFLGRVAADIVSARLDEHTYLQQTKRAAVVSERIRVSREIHDGVLQSLTGIALQLKVTERILESDPRRAISILSELRGFILERQRDLRAFITSLREDEGSESGLPLEMRLMSVADSARIEWGIDVTVDLGPIRKTIPETLIREVTALMHEALANAGKHGEATRAVLSIDCDSNRLRVAVEDNGRGFPAEGRWKLTEMNETGLGPLTLRERVGELGGELTITSTSAGASVEIEIPMATTPETA